jgi:hypothetical protein
VEDIGIGNNFMNKIPVAHLIKTRIDRRDDIKREHKTSLNQRKQFPES